MSFLAIRTLLHIGLGSCSVSYTHGETMRTHRIIGKHRKSLWLRHCENFEEMEGQPEKAGPELENPL